MVWYDFRPCPYFKVLCPSKQHLPPTKYGMQLHCLLQASRLKIDLGAGADLHFSLAPCRLPICSKTIKAIGKCFLLFPSRAQYSCMALPKNPPFFAIHLAYPGPGTGRRQWSPQHKVHVSSCDAAALGASIGAGPTQGKLGQVGSKVFKLVSFNTPGISR